MRHARNRSRAIALAATVAAMVAGCANATPGSSTTSASPVAASASTLPASFAASFPFTSATGERGDLGERIALVSSRNGDLLRWLTPQQDGVFDSVLAVHDGWVYFLRGVVSLSVWRVPVTGGRAQLIQAGATDFAVSADGRAVAYVTTSDHGNVVELVTWNRATGRQNTIILSARPNPQANNWPPSVSGLTWAPDDVHLALQFELTAAISSVRVFDAFTARTFGDGGTAPPGCPVTAKPACEDFDPAYLASGTLTYIVQRTSASGTASASLVKWQAGRLTTLLSFATAPSASYDLTPQEQAIWADAPASPGKPWTIWRWSGGTPAKITILPPPNHELGPIAW